MSRLNVNVICLAGALIGTLAVFTTWSCAASQPGSMGWDWGPLRPLEAVTSIPSILLPVFSFLVIGGVALAFVSPLGGFLQASGVLLYLFYFILLPKPEFFEGRLIPDSGPFFAILSSSMVIVSFLWPHGVGYRERVSLRSRLLTIFPNANRSAGGLFAAPLYGRLLSGLGIALSIGGAGASVYSFKVASTMDSWATWIAPNARPLLYLLGILGAIIGAFGCVLFFASRRYRQIPERSSTKAD